MDVANNPEVEVFIELIGGCDLAKDLVETSIRNGKHIVTANKALIATHGDELFELAKEYNVQIGFEASVAGGTRNKSFEGRIGCKQSQLVCWNTEWNNKFYFKNV